MRRRFDLLALLLVLICALTVGSAAAGEAMPLTLVRTIALPGVEGRIDHFALDTKGQRLFLAALGNSTVEVIDLVAGKVIHQIAGQKEPQGVAFIPETHEVVVANGDDGSVRFFDATTWALVKSIDLTGDADNLRYDSAKHIVYVGYGDGGIAAIDPTTHAVMATIPLSGHPEAFTLEPGGARLFVNVPNAHHVAVLDRTAAAVTAMWDLAEGFPDFFTASVGRASANFPMAIDEADHRLFIGCRKPACVLVFDTMNNKPVARVDVSGDTDDVFYDAATRRLYLSCGEGFVDVIEQTDADHYRRIAQVPTASGARTALWVPETRLFYLAIPHRGSQAPAIRCYLASQP